MSLSVPNAARIWPTHVLDFLVWQYRSRPAELLREVFHLRQPVLYVQHGFLIVHVQRGLEGEVRNDRSVHIDDGHVRMLGEDVPSACLAPLAKTAVGPVEGTNIIRALCDSYAFPSPERKSIHWPGRPVTAGLAMAISHGDRIAADSELDCSTKTLAWIGLLLIHGASSNDFWSAYCNLEQRFAATITQTPGRGPCVMLRLRTGHLLTLLLVATAVRAKRQAIEPRLDEDQYGAERLVMPFALEQTRRTIQ
jgi:hypothetical protein